MFDFLFRKKSYQRSNSNRRLMIQPLENRINLSAVTLTITGVEEIDNPDPEPGPFSIGGDYYARVNIDNQGFQQSGEVSFDPGLFSGFLVPQPLQFAPYWQFTRDVDPNQGTAEIVIELWDSDLVFDDKMDINPVTGGTRSLIVTVDLATGGWTSDAGDNQGFSIGVGGSNKSKIVFDISTLSADGDADGDGLLDGWELFGVDANGDGQKLDLPGFGADPLHKDLFVELDWMVGAEPLRESINTVKAAFAVAPVDAGVNASDPLKNGAPSKGLDAKANPDGQPGIKVWFDAGGLTDATGQLVGDNLGGGNPVATLNVSTINEKFYELKGANFTDPDRELVFRYGIYAKTPDNGAGTSTGDNGDSSLNDTNQMWLTNEWSGRIVNITGGTGEGQEAKITSNTATQFFVDDAWEVNPDSTSTYSIDQFGGWGEVGGNDLLLYASNRDAASLMHELGHNLNLGHGGDEGVNYKPNYISIMNYSSAFGIPVVGGGSIIDYSPVRRTVGGITNYATPTTFTDVTQNWTINQFAGSYVEVDNQTRRVVSNDAITLTVDQPWSQRPTYGLSYAIFAAAPVRGTAPLPTLDEANLSETLVLDPTDTSTLMIFTDPIGNQVTFPVGGQDRNGDGVLDGADYNGDGIVDVNPVQVNINSPPTGDDLPVPLDGDELTGHDDWRFISLPFRQFGNLSGAPINLEDDPLPIGNIAPEILSFEVDPSMIDENGETTLSISFSDPDASDIHRALIDWGDGHLEAAPVPAGARSITISHRYLDDDPTGTTVDPYTVRASITDNADTTPSQSAEVLVANLAPVIVDFASDASFGDLAMPGEPVHVSATYTDAGVLDTHEATVDWGDGTPVESLTLVQGAGFGSVSGSHAYAVGGVYEVTMTLTDDDTGTDQSTSLAVITGIGISNGTLYIVGTNEVDGDHVSVHAVGENEVRAHADFIDEAFRTYDLAQVDRIVTYLGEGDDHITIANSLRMPAIVHGGGGNDHLGAGGGPTVLLGDLGDDMLVGGKGRNVLIGGQGLDRIRGGMRDDVLIGGSTDVDDDDDALLTVLAAWDTDDLYDNRVTAVDALFVVLDDEDEDELTGADGLDLFYDGLGDFLNDRKLTETQL